MFFLRLSIRWSILLVLLGGLFAVLPGCSPTQEGPKKEVLIGAVRSYNSMLIRTYMEVNLNLMKDVATEKQIGKLFAVIQALRAEGSLMRTNQTSFTVRDVSPGPGEAVVETEETWDYWWEQKDTGVITKPQNTITYAIRYHLVEENRYWKVDSIETID